jgi:hypothetical protein
MGERQHASRQVFVSEWNSFIQLAASNAQLEWTAEESDASS